ncbi:hypothetical protein BVG94_00580 [Serratia marcescens]|nr:hypothetical protein BVG94_00580 [Serratia marcescens]
MRFFIAGLRYGKPEKSELFGKNELKLTHFWAASHNIFTVLLQLTAEDKKALSPQEESPPWAGLQGSGGRL